MYSLENLKTLLKDPSRLIGVAHHFGTKANQLYYKNLVDHTGVMVMEEDWDNLILLDGCRYDLFESTHSLDGELESRISPGSESAEFLLANFSDQTHHDTVYITANPHVFKLPENTFHATINLLDDGWDSELYTVTPETMANAVRKAHSEFPNKRLIAHFMQPHYPFIGELGRQIQQGGIGRRDKNGNVVDSAGEGDIWMKLQFHLSDLTRNDVWAAYKENLELVLDEIEEMLPAIDGKTVISADHGNLVGDWIGPIPSRGYGHPSNIYVDDLVTVPWLTIQKERRDITDEPPVSYDETDEEIISKRLTAFGYR